MLLENHLPLHTPVLVPAHGLGSSACKQAWQKENGEMIPHQTRKENGPGC